MYIAMSGQRAGGEVGPEVAVVVAHRGAEPAPRGKVVQAPVLSQRQRVRVIGIDAETQELSPQALVEVPPAQAQCGSGSDLEDEGLE